MKRFGAEAKAVIWTSYLAGQTFTETAKRLGISVPGVWSHITTSGGIAPRARARRPSSLTLEEREEISRGLASSESYRAIGQRLGRNASTISREIDRNGGQRFYRAVVAEQRAWDRARRPQPCKLQRYPRLQRVVERALRRRWSPEQIARRLHAKYGGDETMTISHETLYRTLFIQARGAFRKELTAFLRTKRTYRQPRARPSRPGVIQGVSIRERPAEVEDRAVPGHWEVDLIVGKPGTYIATLVERTTRYVLLARVVSKDTTVVMAALEKAIMRLPQHLRKTMTHDRGSEFAGHAQFSIDTNIQIYFCDPHSPWQRGTNENTNGLLRDYFPKGSDLSVFTQRQLDRVANELNGRPRMTLGWKTPDEELNLLLQ